MRAKVVGLKQNQYPKNTREQKSPKNFDTKKIVFSIFAYRYKLKKTNTDLYLYKVSPNSLLELLRERNIGKWVKFVLG